MMMDEQELEDQIAAYALNALSAAERAEVEALLARSAQAQALLARYQALFGGLGALVPHRAAPEGAAERFQARLAAEIAQTKPRRRFSLRLILSAAAIVVVALGILLLLSAQQDDLAALLNDPRAVRIELAPQAAVAGSVRLIALPSTDRGVLVAELPPPAPDRQYQLWFILSETDIRSGGVLEGSQPLRVRVPDPSRAYTLGITLEPRGGSQQPTSAPLFIGSLPPLRQ
jgi:anti-sigma-K factor RskA